MKRDKTVMNTLISTINTTCVNLRSEPKTVNLGPADRRKHIRHF